MRTLGLDPSLTGFGWCVHDSSQTGAARVVARGRLVTTPKDIFLLRYMAVRKAIEDILYRHPAVRAVGVESPPFGEQWSAGLYGLFLYVNEAIFNHRKDVVYFDPGSLKMLAKGDPSIRKGTMFKSDMVDAARADTGIKGKFNHNEADAYHVARFTARFWAFVDGEIQESDLTPAEYRAFARVYTPQRGVNAGKSLKMGAVFKEGQRYFKFSKVGPADLDAIAKKVDT